MLLAVSVQANGALWPLSAVKFFAVDQWPMMWGPNRVSFLTHNLFSAVQWDLQKVFIGVLAAFLHTEHPAVTVVTSVVTSDW